MSTTRVLIGLAAGLLVGQLASVTQSPALLAIVRGLEPLGTLFVNAIRMTVVPLVTASLIVGIASAGDTRLLTRLGGRSMVLFVVLALAGALFAAALALPALAWLNLGPDTLVTLRETAAANAVQSAGAAGGLSGLSGWLVSLVPPNPIRAAADGDMLPLIVFTVIFGAALTQLPAPRREPIVAFFGGLADAMMVIVRWVLVLAPVGVFALAAPLAARVGAAAAGALLSYIALAVILTVAFVLLVLYPLTAAVGRVSLARFARACAPAQAVAFSSRSTLATLPAMLDATRTLGLRSEVTAFVVPLAASIFRVGSAVGQTAGVLFAAYLYGATPGAAQIVTIIVTVVLTTFTVPGIPGGSIIVMVPILLAANLPVEGVGVLLAADAIPDMFRTTANVTGGIAAAVMVNRGPERVT
jgi:proton glutamate symport protein